MKKRWPWLAWGQTIARLARPNLAEAAVSTWPSPTLTQQSDKSDAPGLAFVRLWKQSGAHFAISEQQARRLGRRDLPAS